MRLHQWSRCSNEVVTCSSCSPNGSRSLNSRFAFRVGHSLFALRSWRAFVADRLGYEDEARFPPRSTVNMPDWFTLFRNAGTACNYVGCSKWLVTFHGVKSEWYNGPARRQFKGFKEMTMAEAWNRYPCNRFLDAQCWRLVVTRRRVDMWYLSKFTLHVGRRHVVHVVHM